jgi:V8-like Glu-specific endopeptidase
MARLEKFVLLRVWFSKQDHAQKLRVKCQRRKSMFRTSRLLMKVGIKILAFISIPLISAPGLPQSDSFEAPDLEAAAHYSRAIANVIDQDDRVALEPNQALEYPFSCIGRLSFNGGFCTATLVGPNLILTNAHCAENGETFTPAYSSGTAPVGSCEVVDWYQGSGEDKGDWAIGLLSENLGNLAGWMHVYPLFFDWHGQPKIGYGESDFVLAGYSGDIHNGRRMSVHSYCSISDSDGSLLSHCCDMTRGASGSPIFSYWPRSGNWALIAVNSSEIRRGEDSEIGVPCSEFPNFAVASMEFEKELRLLADKFSSKDPFRSGIEKAIWENTISERDIESDLRPGTQSTGPMCWTADVAFIADPARRNRALHLRNSIAARIRSYLRSGGDLNDYYSFGCSDKVSPPASSACFTYAEILALVENNVCMANFRSSYNTEIIGELRSWTDSLRNARND